MFESAEIIAFLQAADKYLDRPFRIDVIGGAAAALNMAMQSGTEDIDTTTTDVGSIMYAFEAAARDTGLAIPVRPTMGVHDAPYRYEERIGRVRIEGLRHLQVFVPEVNDWALMKVVRLWDKDLEHLKEVSNTVGFDREALLIRFISEMTHAHGGMETLLSHFLLAMRELYGEEEALRMELEIRRYRAWGGTEPDPWVAP